MPSPAPTAHALRLGRETSSPITDPAQLGTWISPSGSNVSSLRTRELVTLDPATGRPVFYDLAVDYTHGAGRKILEFKSFKLWLWHFRYERLTRTQLCDQILQGLAGALDAARVTVDVRQRGRFEVRTVDGGVAITTDLLTALCPATGLPDLYDLDVILTGVNTVDPEVLRAHLAGFAETGIGVEDLAAHLRDDLRWLYPAATAGRVELLQYLRGGIECTTVSYFPDTAGGTPQ